jgi:hypothetical protein
MNKSEWSTAAAEQGGGASAAAVEAFIARWAASSGAERALPDDNSPFLLVIGHARRTDSGYAAA